MLELPTFPRILVPEHARGRATRGIPAGELEPIMRAALVLGRTAETLPDLRQPDPGCFYAWSPRYPEHALVGKLSPRTRTVIVLTVVDRKPWRG